MIQLPTDSDVRGEAELGDFQSDGVLGAVALKTDLGAVRLAETGPLNLRAGVGEVTVEGVSGSAEVHCGSGDIRIGAVDGTAEVSNSNGKVRVGVVTGPANVKSSNGSVSVDRALSDITAASSNGEVRIGEVVRGKVSATSKNGSVEVGIREGSAAWLELNTGVGRVYNELDVRRRPRGRRAGRQGRGPRQHQARRRHHPPRPAPGGRGVNTDLIRARPAPTALAPRSRPAACASPSAAKTVLDGIDLTVPPGTILALLGPNGAGKTTAVHLLTTYLRPDAGDIRIAGQDPAKNPQAVRRAIGVTGQFSAVDGYLTGRENLMLMADLHLLPKKAGRRRAEDLLERFELTEAGGQAGVDLLRRHEAQARPGDDPGRQPEGDLPRRADHGPGPAQPAHDVGHHPRAGRGGDDHPAHDPVPGRGRPARAPRRGAGRRPDRRRGDARRAQGAHPRRAHRAVLRRPRRTRRGRAVLAPTGRDDDALTLQLAGDGRVSTLRTLLRQLDDASVEAEALTVHTPDLDDVFFALTGKKGA